MDSPILQPKPNRPGRPRKSFEDKQRSSHHEEATKVKDKVADHEFQAVLLAAVYCLNFERPAVKTGDLNYSKESYEVVSGIRMSVVMMLSS